MKIIRSVKCYYPWLTQEKKNKILEFLGECHKIVNYCIKYHEKDILDGVSKYKLLLKENINKVTSWISFGAKQACFREAYSLIIGAKRSAGVQKIKYITPTHYKNQIFLSSVNAKINTDPKLKDFDLLVELYTFDLRKRNIRLAVPLKRNKMFNKWLSFGRVCNSILLTNEYIQFSFEMRVEKKKTGDIAGYDPGAINMLTDDTGKHYGDKMCELLLKLKRKKRRSKSWYRCREEIKEYIDKNVKSLPWNELQWLILENNKGIKHKSKIKANIRRKAGKKFLSKRIRSVLTGWARSRIDNRVQMLSEENGVFLRRVPAWYNSVTCPICGCCKKENRASQSEFKCVNCGHVDNADRVGTLNSLARFALGTYGSECKQRFIEKHPDYYKLKEVSV
jgi:transposase